MSADTPDREPVNVPTTENVAESLTVYDNDYDEGNCWWPSLTAKGNVVHIGITPHDDEGEKLPEVHFRAVVVEGDEAPLVLEWPAELGLSNEDGSDLLALTSNGIRLHPQDVAGRDMDPEEALELAAQLAAMAMVWKAALAAQAGAANGGAE